MRRLGAALFGLAVALLLGEIAARIAHVEARWLPDLTYYQSVDVAVHRPSEDPRLSYELEPSARAIFASEGTDEAWTPKLRSVSVNALGARGRERTAQKPPGTFRVLALGGSNTYGAAVGDGDPWPDALEAALHARGRPEIEVWNLGVSGYVTGQKVAMAERALAWQPDLLLFQMSNTGPRNLLLTDDLDVLARYRWDPTLWRDTVLACPPLDSLAGRLFLASELVRTAALASDRYRRRRPPGVEFQPPNAELDERAELAAEATFRAFLARVPEGVDVALVYPAEGGGSQWLHTVDLWTLDLNRAEPKPDRPDAMHIHPGREVYGWYGDRLAEAIDRSCTADGCDFAHAGLPWVYR
jgi:hypothetical protein